MSAKCKVKWKELLTDTALLITLPIWIAPFSVSAIIAGMIDSAIKGFRKNYCEEPRK